MDAVFVAFVSHFGRKGHRPRIIAVGVLMSGIGFLLCGLPHVMLTPYTSAPSGCNATKPFLDYCSAHPEERDVSCSLEFEKPAFNPVVWLIIGQILVGIGNVPMRPLGTTYIDDFVRKKETPILLGKFS